MVGVTAYRQALLHFIARFFRRNARWTRSRFGLLVLLGGVLHPLAAQAGYVGLGVYSELSDDLFIARLTIDSQRDNPLDDLPRWHVAKKLEFKFLGDQFSFRRFTALMMQNAAINTRPEVLQANIRQIERLVAILRVKGKIARGDHVLFRSVKNGVHVYLNDLRLGFVDNPDIFVVVLNAWIGEIPPSRALKDGLLGVEENPFIAQVFDNLHYSGARKHYLASVLPQSGSASRKPQVKPPELVASKPVEPAARPFESKPLESALPSPVASEGDNTATVPALPVGESAPIAAQSPAPVSPEPPALVAVQSASLATAPQQSSPSEPASLAPEPTEPEPPSAFSPEEIQEQRQHYARALMKHAQKNLVYPRRYQKMGIGGSLLAVVTIARDGAIIDLQFEEKTHSEALNKEVENALKRAQPFPGLPEAIQGETFTFSLPISFVSRS